MWKPRRLTTLLVLHGLLQNSFAFWGGGSSLISTFSVPGYCYSSYSRSSLRVVYKSLYKYLRYGLLAACHCLNSQVSDRLGLKLLDLILFPTWKLQLHSSPQTCWTLQSIRISNCQRPLSLTSAANHVYHTGSC
jgi:hypothetical protein